MNPSTTEITIVPDDFTSYFKNTNEKGGRGYFLPQPYINILASVLKEVLPVKDVDIQLPAMWPVKMGTSYDGALTYIHKVKDGRNIYFLSNSTKDIVNTSVKLRGNLNPEIWDPHTGEQKKAEFSITEEYGEKVTTIRLQLGPLSSLFFIAG